uniref:Beta-parvin n=1 Tax=Schistosoma haematobium TaxID=6185 RepID=A0A095A4M8_SCHHA
MTIIAGLKSHDSILSKLDTFKRKRKARLEVEELNKESRQAIEMAVSALTTDDPKQYQLEEGQERSFIEKSSQNSEGVKNLVDKLLTWINNELSEHRILVRDIQEDLYDGQLLQKLVEKLAKIKLDHPELTLSEIGQLQRLRGVLQTVNEVLHVSETWASQRWTAERIQQKDFVAILRLLVVIARQFKPEMRFQAGIFLTVIIARKLNGKLEYRYEREYITEVTETLPAGSPFDAISEHHMVLQAVLTFINTHLEQVGLHVNDLSKDVSFLRKLLLISFRILIHFIEIVSVWVTITEESVQLI